MYLAEVSAFGQVVQMTAENDREEADAAKLGAAGSQEADAAKLSAKEATGNGGRKLSPLSYLTAQSARFGVWEVAIFKPEAQSREYLWNKEKRTTHQFQCILVSTDDPTQYLLGNSHGRGVNEAKIKALADKFRQGLVFQMSNVQFAHNVKQQYNSAPKTDVVAMHCTTFSPVLVSAAKPILPAPGIPIAACMSIGQEQLFDALALIENISEMAPGGTTSAGQRRVRCTISLIDGSTKEGSEKICSMPVTVFANATLDGTPPSLFKELEEMKEGRLAGAFFGIQGKKAPDDGTWSFTSAFSFHCHLAEGTKKGKALNEQALELLRAEAETVPLSTRPVRVHAHDTMSFEDMEATETTCALLKTLMLKTQLKAIETGDSFWQINWCQVYPPDKAAQVCTNDGSRLWMPVKVEDETGHLNIFIREKAALALSGTDSKEAFEEARAADTLEFPKKTSIKVIRKASAFETPRADSDDSAGKPEVNCYIVEAGEQPMEETPSKRSLELMALLSRTEPASNACVPACLSMITKNPHYGLSVRYKVEGGVVEKTCTKAVALVVASNASKSDNMNEGYQMITENVKSALDDEFTCTLMSFCTVQSSPDYQLKPGRGQKTQMAMVTIADVLDAGSGDKPPVFLVEALEKIPASDAASAPEHMRRVVFFAALTAKSQGQSLERGWTEELSPAIAGKCRRLGKSPTGEMLEQYSRSS